MSKSRLDKKIVSLEGEFEDVLVCRSSKYRPYIEIFVQAPENVSQENLGTIAGVFEIEDTGEDSSYIVNYLISVIKKEFFSSTKRGAVESFEAALHKANLALSKLAEHGSIDWIGKLGAVVTVIEKNNIHFSQTGSAGIFLLRAKSFTNISEAEEGDFDPNPLKTFQDVVSGRLEIDDKILIATHSIFDIFSFEELKRSALKFTKPEFIQFLKTALTNELERVAVLTVDIGEKKESAFSQPKQTQKVNAFSREAFAKKQSSEHTTESLKLQSEEKQKIIADLKIEYEKEKGDFIDQKTGHIYIKDDGLSPKSSTAGTEKLKESIGSIAEASSRSLTSLKEKGGSFLSIFKKNAPAPNESNERKVWHVPVRRISASLQVKLASIVSLVKKGAVLAGSAIASTSLAATRKSTHFATSKLIPLSQAFVLKIFRIFKSSRERVRRKLEKKPGFSTSDSDYPQVSRQEKKSWFQALSGSNTSPSMDREKRYFSERKSAPSFLSVLPDLSRLKNAYINLDYTKKIYAILFIVLLFVAPFYISKLWGTREESAAPQTEIPREIVLPLTDDANVERVDNVQSAYSGQNILDVLEMNGKIYATTGTEISDIGESKSYALPDEFKNPDKFAAMDDLNLLFIFANNKIGSFSPTSGKFSENSISIPDGSDIASIRTYLTYAYLLDTKNSQIYRYPRAEGGFGAKNDWLKDSIDLSNATDMAISDNIYLANGSEIIRLFQGKKQNFTIGQTATPIISDKVYTRPESQNIYVLDKNNSRIVKLDLDGNIIQQYYNSEIVNSTGFTVDEENNKVYFATSTSIKSFGIN